MLELIALSGGGSRGGGGGGERGRGGNRAPPPSNGIRNLRNTTGNKAEEASSDKKSARVGACFVPTAQEQTFNNRDGSVTECLFFLL